MARSLAHRARGVAAGKPGDRTGSVPSGGTMHFGYIAVPLGVLLLWMALPG
jgi:hypothetical protein